ncbi:MAG: Gfo/Idh/MocA family protein [Planctomycetota bacterium]|jgi:predicted dehydrogenase
MSERMKLRVGVAGVGLAGRAHLAAWREVPSAEVVAAADPVMEAVAEKAGAGLDGLRRFDDAREMALDPEVDAIDLCAPTYLHARLAVAALKVGKHVLCEAPMANEVVDADRMVEVSLTNGAVLMVGHAPRFSPAHVWTKKALGSRTFGKVLAASFRSFAPLPAHGWKDWFLDEMRSGGAALDLHVNEVDVVRWFLGSPRAVTSRASGLRHLRTVYDFGDGLAVSAECDWVGSSAYPAGTSFLISCERGAIDYDSRREPVLAAYTRSGDAEHPDLPERDALVEELAHFAARAGEGKRPANGLPDDAREAVRIVWAEVRSAQTGLTVAL